jgi:hypothetical protein
MTSTKRSPGKWYQRSELMDEEGLDWLVGLFSMPGELKPCYDDVQASQPDSEDVKRYDAARQEALKGVRGWSSEEERAEVRAERLRRSQMAVAAVARAREDAQERERDRKKAERWASRRKSFLCELIRRARALTTSTPREVWNDFSRDVLSARDKEIITLQDHLDLDRIIFERTGWTWRGGRATAKPSWFVA